MPSGCSGGKPHSLALGEEQVGRCAAGGGERERVTLAPGVVAVGVHAERLVQVQPGTRSTGERRELLVDEPLGVDVVAEGRVVVGDREGPGALALGPGRPVRPVRLVVRAEAGVVGELRMRTEVRLERVAARAGLGVQRAGERLQHRPPQVLRSGVVDVRALGERAALAPEGPRGEQLPRRGRALELRARREVGVELVPEEPARRRVRARLVRERREQGRAADQIPSEPADIAQQRLDVSQVGDPHRPLRAHRVQRQEDAPSVVADRRRGNPGRRDHEDVCGDAAGLEVELVVAGGQQLRKRQAQLASLLAVDRRDRCDRQRAELELVHLVAAALDRDRRPRAADRPGGHAQRELERVADHDRDDRLGERAPDLALAHAHRVGEVVRRVDLGAERAEHGKQRRIARPVVLAAGIPVVGLQAVEAGQLGERDLLLGLRHQGDPSSSWRMPRAGICSQSGRLFAS